MTEDPSPEETTQPGTGPDHHPDQPERTAADPAEIDMSAFEELFAGPPAPDRPGDTRQPVEPARQHPPTVEWAVRWADGRLTRVRGEHTARLAADRFIGCEAVCRVVGPWGAA